jgi:hypothetical protein
MNEQPIERTTTGFWTLNKVFVLLLLGAIAALLLEIRYDHRDVIHETPVSWTPLIYAGVTLLLGIIGLATWDRFGRAMLLVVFACGMIVGPVGFWFHNQGRPVRGVARMLSAWEEPVYAAGDESKGKTEHKKPDGKSDEQGEKGASEGQKGGAETGGDQPDNGGVALQRPPILAPLSFFGLGLMGVVACMGRFQPNRDVR